MKKSTLIVLLLIIAGSLFSFAGGTGTEADPYLVETAEHLDSVRNHLSASFRQIADIDLADYLAPGGSGYNNGAGWEPIGWYLNYYDNEPFTGSYDGDEFIISNLFINREEETMYHHGLFGYGGNSAYFANIFLENVDITGYRTGALTGYMEGIIDNCYSTGEISGVQAAGLVHSLDARWYSQSLISNCYSTCDVTAVERAAGLIVILDHYQMTNCFATGEVTAYEGTAAGLVLSVLDFSIVEYSYATGNVTGSGMAGGLVSFANHSIIQQCYAMGNVYVEPSADYGTSAAGGLINYAESVQILNCFATGDVEGGGDAYLGGFISQISLGIILRNSYSTGKVSGEPYAGGFSGYQHSTQGVTVENNYWDFFSSCQPESVNGTGLTTALMMQQSSFTDWDFEDVWQIDENQSYPYLQNNLPAVVPAPPDRIDDLGVLTVLGQEAVFIDSLSTHSVVVFNMGSNPQSGFIVRLLLDEDTELTNVIVTETIAQYEQIYVEIEWVASVAGEYNLRGVVELAGDEYEPNNTTNLFPVKAYYGFAGGHGTAEVPFQVASPEQFYLLRYFMDSHFEQTDDIDLSVFNDEEGWQPIGNYCIYDESKRQPFTGNYNGNGFRVHNGIYSFTSGYFSALFAYLGEGGIVRNTVVENITFNNAFLCHYLGGLVGKNSGTIENSSVTGITLEGEFPFIGGLVYSNEGIIVNCHTGFEIESYSVFFSVGGLVVENEGKILDSYSTADVTAEIECAGLAVVNEGIIKRSYFTGNVTGTNNPTGGLVGSNYNLIEECFSTGSVSGSFRVGGLVGRSEGTIKNSYSLANVEGESFVGGLIGWAFQTGTVLNCFSAGLVSGNYHYGGLAGVGHGSFVNSYWDIETSGQTVSQGGEGRTTAEMMQQSTFLDWDFELVWDILQNESYPFLHYQEGPISVSEETETVPQTTMLTGNYPNPFNPKTTISFTLSRKVEFLELKIYNLRGQLVRTLVSSAPHPEGDYRIIWDGSNDQGKQVSSGVFFYRLITPDYDRARKMLLLK